MCKGVGQASCRRTTTPRIQLLWIERTLDQHHPLGMMVLVGGPYGERIRASSDWPAIARKINLPAK